MPHRETTPSGIAHHPLDRSDGNLLAPYLHAQAAEFLRALRRHGECTEATDPDGSARSALDIRRAARRIGGALHTFRPLTDRSWADPLRAELAWLSGTLAREHAHAEQLGRLLDALQRLNAPTPLPTARPHRAAPVRGPRDDTPGSGTASPGTASPGTAPRGTVAGGAAPGRRGADGGAPGRTPPGVAASGGETPAGTTAGRTAPAGAPVAAPAGTPAAAPAGTPASRPPSRETALGIARAGALLERQLTLARTRAHSAALQALGSSRFHAVADAVAVLASEAPVTPGDPYPCADHAAHRLAEAVAALPLGRAARPYNSEAVHEGQDSPWHHVRLLLRLHRYAQEVIGRDTTTLEEASRILDQHRDAAEAAAAAASAARTARIAPATAYALGILHSEQRHEVEAARFAFQRQWRQTAVGVGARRG
ncbi:CHAD domain-containing protein [Streptomyces sp. CA-294286]|uniref:CHAD domain-containing protein n=1 Tax=Streptomyces sp. CA-294286 TaxID=3240070 RepID=UPI003D9359F0